MRSGPSWGSPRRASRGRIEACGATATCWTRARVLPGERAGAALKHPCKDMDRGDDESSPRRASRGRIEATASSSSPSISSAVLPGERAGAALKLNGDKHEQRRDKRFSPASE